MPYLIITLCLFFSLLIVRISKGRISPNTGVGIAGTTGMRELQADAGGHVAREGETLLLVADGIGSGKKGSMAAQVAIEIVSRQFEAGGTGQNPVYFFRNAFHAANAAILRHIPDATAGACLLAAVIKNGMLHYALAGNCNLYLYRNQRLYPVSEGQTIDVLARKAFKEKRLERKETLQMLRDTRAYNYLGKDGLREVELPKVPICLKDQDIIILSTDGVQDATSARELKSLLGGHGDCAEKAQSIIQEIERKKLPEQDNAFVVLARYQA